MKVAIAGGHGEVGMRLADMTYCRELIDAVAGASEWTDPVTRRHFMRIMSASFMLAGLGLAATGCRRPVEKLEPFVMRSVTRPVHVEERHDQTGPILVTTDAARGLDVFGRGLRLTENHHQPKPRDVEADGDHVRGESDVDPVVVRVEEREPPLRVRHLARRLARRELHRLVRRSADSQTVHEARRRGADRHSQAGATVLRPRQSGGCLRARAAS